MGARRILISGSLAYDRIMNFRGFFADHIIPEKTHNINLSFLVEELRESYGGTAGNIAYTSALLGEAPVIIAHAGNDFEPYRAWLNKNDVDTSLVDEDKKVRTAFATIITDSKNNQITAFYAGAMQKEYETDSLAFEGDIAIVAPGNPEDMRAFPPLFRSLGFPYIFDPGQQIPALSGEDLKEGIEGSRAVVVNDYELALIAQKTGWSEKEILGKTELLVTTLGADGSCLRSKKETISVPAAKPKNTEDPTGAGDAYRAGLITGLLNGWPLDTIGKFAGVVACYTVETRGTQTHAFTKKDLHERYKENFKDRLPDF